MTNTQHPLQKYLEETNESTLSFSRRACIPSATLYRIIKKMNKPYRRTAVKICRHSKGMLKMEDFGFEWGENSHHGEDTGASYSLGSSFFYRQKRNKSSISREREGLLWDKKAIWRNSNRGSSFFSVHLPHADTSFSLKESERKGIRGAIQSMFAKRNFCDIEACPRAIWMEQEDFSVSDASELEWLMSSQM